MTATKNERPKVGSVWTWRKGDPEREAQIAVANVQYYGFAWFVFIERCDGTRFEDGLKQIQVPLERFIEKASKPDAKELHPWTQKQCSRSS
jgi:hypothetical protein